MINGEGFKFLAMGTCHNASFKKMINNFGLYLKKVFKERLLSLSRCKDNERGLESQKKLYYDGSKLKSR